MSTSPGCLSRRSTGTSEANTGRSGTPYAFLALSLAPLEEASRQQADRDAEEASDEHVRPEMNSEIHTRQGDHHCKGEQGSSEARMEHADGGGGSEGGRGMAGRERRGIRERDERLNRRVGNGRAGALGEVLQEHGHSLGKRGSARGCEGGGRKATPKGVTAAAGHREERPLDPPGRSKHEDRGERAPVEAV